MTSKDDSQTTDQALTANHRVPRWLQTSIILFIVALAGLASYISSTLNFSEFRDLKKTTDNSLESVSFQSEVKRLDGSIETLLDPSSKLTLITFWATWCPPCLEELPMFNKLNADFANKGLKVQAVNVEQELDSAQLIEFWKKHNLQFALVRDIEARNQKDLNIETLPNSFLVDQKGQIRFISRGFSDWASKEAHNLVQELLEEDSSK